MHTSEPERIVLASWAPFLGGAEIALERLAVGLQDQGHEVSAILGARNVVWERCEKAGVHCIQSPIRFTDKWRWPIYWWARRRLQLILGRERPVLVHSNDLPTHQIVSDAAKLLKIPRLCHHRFPFPGKAIDWFNKFGAERHLFVSRALMEEMITQSPRLEVAPRAVVYDGLPIPTPVEHTARQGARQRLGLPMDKAIILFAGQIIERKGVEDLVRAWALLTEEERAAAELVIVGDDLQGDGRYRDRVKQLAAGLSPSPRFMGFQNNLPEWLIAADLAVVPSHVEPLGNVTLEAMAHGLPVIGAAVGGIPEMIIAEETGLLVPAKAPSAIAAALRVLLSQSATRLRMGAQGRQRCERLFSLEAHTRAVVEQYQIMLADGGRRP